MLIRYVAVLGEARLEGCYGGVKADLYGELTPVGASDVDSHSVVRWLGRATIAAAHSFTNALVSLRRPIDEKSKPQFFVLRGIAGIERGRESVSAVMLGGKQID